MSVSDLYTIHSHMIHFLDAFIIYRLDLGNCNSFKVGSLQRQLVQFFLSGCDAHLLNGYRHADLAEESNSSADSFF